MIKICALDLLNKENFPTDIKTADGRILFKAGDIIKPELILRLYFRDIYIEESLVAQEQKAAAIELEAEKEKEKQALAVGSSSTMEETIDGKSPALFDSNVAEEPDLTVPRTAEPSIDLEASTDAINPSTPNLDVINIDQGPIPVTNDLDISVSKINPATPDLSIKDSKINPASPNLDLNDSGISAPIPDLSHDRTLDLNKQASIDNLSQSNKKEPSPELSQEDLDPQLEFSEDQAKRIVDISVKLGKISGYTNTELKELADVAYYYNIGISKFRKSDMKKHNFRKLKAYASYQDLEKLNKLNERLIDIIKFSANEYETDSFALNSKIPYNHIISIVGFYEDKLAAGWNKIDTLLEMLRLGGNQFNIFVLHKFLKIMRDLND